MVLSYLAASLRRRIQHHNEVLIVVLAVLAALVAGLGLLWAVRAAEFLWLALLFPFLFGFQSSPMYKRLVFEEGRAKQERDESVKWYLAYLALSIVALEACFTSLALTEASIQPFLCLSMCSLLPLFAYFHSDFRDNKAVLIFAQLLACTGPIFIHLLSPALHSTVLALSFALYPASFVVIFRALRRKCRKWSGPKALQAAYFAVLIGKIAGSVTISLLVQLNPDSQSVLSHCTYVLLGVSGGLGVLGTAAALRVQAYY